MKEESYLPMSAFLLRIALLVRFASSCSLASDDVLVMILKI